MHKKRLENALNAAKLIRLGFSLNCFKPDKIDLLYTVNCGNHGVLYVNEELNELQRPASGAKQQQKSLDRISSSDSEPEVTVKKSTRNKKRPNSQTSKNSNQGSDDFEEKIEVLCLKLNETYNLIAFGDSNGNIKVI